MTAPAAQAAEPSAPSIVRLWLHGLTWTILSAGLERVIAVVQTVVIARILGIEDYGRYGLIFGTIGLVASIAGFQLGATATAYIARYRHSDPGAAAGVIVLAEGLSLLAALAGLAVMAIAPEQTATWLFKQASYAEVMLPAGIIIMFAVVAGVQDGILQGFEAFRALAWVRVVVAVLTFALVAVVGGAGGGLRSVLIAIAAGGAVRFVIMLVLQKQLWSADGLRYSRKALWSMRHALLEFSVPAVLGNLLLGLVMWYGTFLLSRAPGGFEDVAIAAAAQQWRGPVLFLNGSLATVAIPLMSRTADAGGENAWRIHRLNVWSNLAVAVIACLVIALASRQILGAYGHGFVEQQEAFVLIVASVIGQSHVQVLFQLLVSMRRIWLVLLYQTLFILPFAAGYQLLLPELGLAGFAWLNVAVWSAAAVALHVLLAARLRHERARPA
jgi:O-antigen/teichoic acid export membrane protein